MTFVDLVKDRISNTPFSEKDQRNLLKLVLGEIQRKSVTEKVTDEACHRIVKSMIEANREVMGHVTEDSPHYRSCVVENEVLSGLLPEYWSKDQIREALASVDLTAAKSDGQAIGMAMKHLKSVEAPVEGADVKEVVITMRH